MLSRFCLAATENKLGDDTRAMRYIFAQGACLAACEEPPDGLMAYVATDSRNGPEIGIAVSSLHSASWPSAGKERVCMRRII